MTVEELIALLQQMPKDAIIVVVDPAFGEGDTDNNVLDGWNVSQVFEIKDAAKFDERPVHSGLLLPDVDNYVFITLGD